MLQQPTRPPDVMLRQPVAAGRFYAREPEILRRDVAAFLAGAVPLGHEPTRLAMAGPASLILRPWSSKQARTRPEKTPHTKTSP